MLPRYPGWFSANFSEQFFFPVGPPPVGTGDLVVFWPVSGRGQLEKLRDWAKNKAQFPGARGPKIGKKNVTTLSGMVVRNALRFARPDRQGREIAKYGDFRPVWPGTAFGT